MPIDSTFYFVANLWLAAVYRTAQRMGYVTPAVLSISCILSDLSLCDDVERRYMELYSETS